MGPFECYLQAPQQFEGIHHRKVDCKKNSIRIGIFFSNKTKSATLPYNQSMQNFPIFDSVVGIKNFNVLHALHFVFN